MGGLAAKRKNLDVRTEAFIFRVRFVDDTDSKVAGGEYFHQHQVKRVRARKEVIICGGAVNTPQLLMLSGIGDPEELYQLHIPCIIPLPGVGKNLQDHLEVRVQNYCSQPASLYPYTRWWRSPLVAAQWMLTKSGVGSGNHLDVGGFVRSSTDATR